MKVVASQFSHVPFFNEIKNSRHPALLEDESINHVVPPLFIDTSQHQTQKVLSYFCTITGASSRIQLLPYGFIDWLRDVFKTIYLCTFTNRALSKKHTVSTISHHSFLIFNNFYKGTTIILFCQI